MFDPPESGRAVRTLGEIVNYSLNDPITEMPNRTMFTSQLSSALRSVAGTDLDVAVLFIDLDGFKLVNESLGYGAGDQLLRAAAWRINGCVRKDGMAARLAGDEFAVLLPSGRSGVNVMGIARELITRLCEPFWISDREVFIGACVGLATGQRIAGDLLQHADLAMRQAKSRGSGSIVRFEPGMVDDALDRLELEADLRRAVQRRELRLVYQPIVELDSGRIEGVEALVRWSHPERGMVQPAAFIPFSEEIGLINEIGTWVLRSACRQLATWHHEGADPDLTMSINVSGLQLADPNVNAVVDDAIRSHDVDPTKIVLEITESVLVPDSDAMIARLAQFRERGIALAIDDFGTGYATLRYLDRFRVDTVKIPREFVRHLTSDAEPPVRTMAETIIGLGRNLGLRVVAEGIENVEQLEVLRGLGCEYAQGMHLGVPSTAAQLEPKLLRSAAIPVART